MTEQAENFNFRTHQKNDLFDIVMEECDTVADFSISPPKRRQNIKKGEPAFSLNIKHLRSDARFGIGWYTEEGATVGPFAVVYQPHSERSHGNFQLREWSLVLHQFRRWLDAIFIAALPDKWAEHERTSLVRPAVSEQYNTPFSAAEVAQIGRSFDSALEAITERQLLTARHLEELTAFVVEQKASASTTKRIDWQSKVVDGLITFGLDKIGNSETAKHVMDIIASNFLWLSHQIGPAISRISGYLTSGGQ
jgi:hypothetical protein